MRNIDYRDAIIRLYHSPEYQELSAYYQRRSALNILGIARRETVHSNMLAWLLSSEESHGFGTFPIRNFLQLLVVSKRKFFVNSDCDFPEKLMDGFITGALEVTRVDVRKEVSIFNNDTHDKKGGRIDLLLHVEMIDGPQRVTLPIVVENKVDSDEHEVKALGEKQTDAYHNWAIKKYADKTQYIQPLFVYLTPDGMFDLAEGLPDCKPCSNKKYIRINYQGIVDYVIAPCVSRGCRSDTKAFLNDYLRCLSYEDISKEGKARSIMAIAPREKELLHAFWEKNEPLLLAAMNALADDPSAEIEDDVREVMKKTVRGVAERDNTKYKISSDGEVLGQGRMVLAVVKKYVSQHGDITLSQLEKVFPKELSKNKFGVVVQLTDEMKISSPKRYFVADEDIIKLSDGMQVVVSSQWGRMHGKGNLPNFVGKAKELGFDLIEV